MARASAMLGCADVSFGVAPVIRTILSMVSRSFSQSVSGGVDRSKKPANTRCVTITPLHPPKRQSYPDGLLDELGGPGCGAATAATPVLLSGSRMVCRGGLSADKVRR